MFLATLAFVHRSTLRLQKNPLSLFPNLPSHYDLFPIKFLSVIPCPSPLAHGGFLSLRLVPELVDMLWSFSSFFQRKMKVLHVAAYFFFVLLVSSSLSQELVKIEGQEAKEQHDKRDILGPGRGYIDVFFFRYT